MACAIRTSVSARSKASIVRLPCNIAAAAGVPGARYVAQCLPWSHYGDLIGWPVLLLLFGQKPLRVPGGLRLVYQTLHAIRSSAAVAIMSRR